VPKASYDVIILVVMVTRLYFKKECRVLYKKGDLVTETSAIANGLKKDLHLKEIYCLCHIFLFSFSPFIIVVTLCYSLMLHSQSY
jgi:hypothetical protein